MHRLSYKHTHYCRTCSLILLQSRDSARIMNRRNEKHEFLFSELNNEILMHNKRQQPNKFLVIRQA